MNVGQEAKQGAMLALMNVLGHGDIFPRVVAEIRRVNKTMPGYSGEDKKKRVIADAKIIFDDIIIPIARQTLNFLIEAALIYLSVKNPAAGAVAAAVVPAVEKTVYDHVDAKIAEDKVKND